MKILIFTAVWFVIGVIFSRQVENDLKEIKPEKRKVRFHNTYAWFKERVYNLQEEEPDHDPANFSSAMTKAAEMDDKIPIGLIYKVDKPTYEDSEPVLLKGPLVKQPLGIKKELFDQLLQETI